MRHVTSQHDFNGLSDVQTAGAWAVLAIHIQYLPLMKDNNNSSYLLFFLKKVNRTANIMEGREGGGREGERERKG